jgi:hemolysin III
MSADEVPAGEEKVKPRYRGSFHFFGFVAALFGLCELIIAPIGGWRYWAGVVYGGSLIMMLGLSALYHRPMWSHSMRSRLRAVDHLGVFFLIAGTYTPFAALQSPDQLTPGLIGMWTGAVAGMIHAMINLWGSRNARAGVYVALGLCAAPMVASLPPYIGLTQTLMMASGAAIYIIGAGVYAKRWPNPAPHLLGYHEVFHFMTLVAGGLHYAVVWNLQQR